MNSVDNNEFYRSVVDLYDAIWCIITKGRLYECYLTLNGN